MLSYLYTAAALVGLGLLCFVFSLHQPPMLDPWSITHHMVSGATEHANVARVIASAASSLCLQCIYMCTWSCPPVTGTLRTDDGFTWTGVQDQAGLSLHGSKAKKTRMQVNVSCQHGWCTPFPGCSRCLLSEKPMKVRDGFTNFWGCSQGPTFGS